MLSAIVLAYDVDVRLSPSPEAVVRTLSALVPAAIEGLIRDVVLAAPAGNGDLHNIADHAGCEIAELAHLEGILAAALAKARGGSLLVLPAGRAPERGFYEELADLSGELGRLRALKVKATPDSFVTRLLPSLSPSVGLVALRTALPADAPHLQALIRGSKAGGTMRARLRRVG